MHSCFYTIIKSLWSLSLPTSKCKPGQPNKTVQQTSFVSTPRCQCLLNCNCATVLTMLHNYHSQSHQNPQESVHQHFSLSCHLPNQASIKSGIYSPSLTLLGLLESTNCVSQWQHFRGVLWIMINDRLSLQGKQFYAKSL